MVASQNGWRANDPSVIASIQVWGHSPTKLRVRKDAPGYLLIEVAYAFDRFVEDIDGPTLDDWGYAERDIRGSTAVSNHASGTAIDLNATRHPLGTNPSANFTQSQIAKIREIIKVTGNVVRWGGDYSGRKDPMHFEINDGQDMQDCQRALAALQKWNAGTTNKPTSAPAPTPVGSTLQKGSTGPAVSKLQAFLNRYYSFLNLTVDGIFGDATANGVKEFQRRYGHGLAVDGILGPATRKAMGI